MVHWLREHGRTPEILVISVMGDESTVLAAIDAGAGSYLQEDSGDAEVIAAIDQLLQDDAPLSPSIAIHLMQRRQKPHRRKGVELSEREAELLRLVAEALWLFRSVLCRKPVAELAPLRVTKVGKPIFGY